VVIAFRDAAEFEAWLDAHVDLRVGVWLKIAKKGSGVPSLTSDEAVDVGLCYGWISGQRKPCDEVYYLQKYVPRRPGSRWSQVNVAKVEDLIADVDMAITISHAGYIKRTPVDVYRHQSRGGKGRIGARTRDEDFVERIRDATDGAGADVILDIIGGAYLDRNVDALAPGGRLIVIGLQGGVKGELNLGKLMGKRAGVIGTTLRARPVDGPSGKGAIVDEVAAHVWPMIADGRVRPITGAVFPIEQAADAHKALSSGKVTGKVILRMQD